MNRGDLVPGEISVRLLIDNISKQSQDQICLVDGFPRNQDNVDWWHKIAEEHVQMIGLVYLDCSVENMKGRIMSRNQGRSDDTEEVFTH